MKNILLAFVSFFVLSSNAMQSKEKSCKDKIAAVLFEVCVNPPFQVLQIPSDKIKVEELFGRTIKINHSKYKEWKLNKPLYINCKMSRNEITKALCVSFNTESILRKTCTLSQDDYQKLFPTVSVSAKTWMQELYQKLKERIPFLDSDY